MPQRTPRPWADILAERANRSPERRAYLFLDDGEREGAALTDRELDQRARAIAARLQERGLAGERALLLYPPGLEFVAAFLGCLLAGVVAVPAYPPHSRRHLPRLLAIAEDARPAALLTTAALRDSSALAGLLGADSGLTCVATDEIPAELAAQCSAAAVTADDLAFLQYTSGSTAAPKGVRVRHGNLLHNEEMIRRAFGQSADSVIVGWLPLYHDMGLIGNVLQPLYAGATCVLMSPLAFLQQPRRWLAAITRYRATTSGGPNFAYDLCARKVTGEALEGLDLSSWQVAFNGAEPVRGDTLARFAAAFAPAGFDARAFFPCYGLAEATLLVSGGEVGTGAVTAHFDARRLEEGEAVAVASGEAAAEGARGLVACGRAWGGQRIAVVDPETGEARRAGQVGEIWVAGPSVAGGYWNRLEATARDFGAFLDEGPAAAGPFLRTGDLGFLHGDELFVTGRLKDLIILRGRNLYPQDVELAAERSHPGLRPGGGAAFAVEAEGEERLVLVQELARGRSTAEAEEIAAAVRRAVAEELEAQLWDIVLIRDSTLPKTSSGKVQRQACRRLYLEGGLAVVGRSGLGEGEEPKSTLIPGRLPLLRDLAAHVLRLPAAAIDPAAPLLAAGLDSLSAAELCDAIAAATGERVEMTRLLGGASLLEVAADVGIDGGVHGTDDGAGAAAAQKDVRVEGWGAGDLPLSQGQRALWFLDRLAPGGSAYVLAGAVRVEGRLDAAALGRALGALTRRHPALGATFHEDGGSPVQRFDEGAEIELTVEEAAFGRGSESGPELAERLLDEARRPFDLASGPLLRATVFRPAPGEDQETDEAVLLLAVHHIVADFASLAILARDLGPLYVEETGGPPADLPPVGASYLDKIARQTALLATDGERLWDFWREELAGAPLVLELPADRPRLAALPEAGQVDGRSVAASWASTAGAALAGLARGSGATLYMALLAAFEVLLARTSGQEDLLLGSPVAGRGGAELAGVVGYFVNPLVVRSDAGGDPTFAELLARVRRRVLRLFAYAEMPFPVLAERLSQAAHAVQPGIEAGRSPVFQVMLTMQGGVARSPRRDPAAAEAPGLAALAVGMAGVPLDLLPGLAAETLALPPAAPLFDLVLDLAWIGAWMGASADAPLAGRFTGDAALFDATTVARLAAHFEALLAGAVARPDARLSELPFLAGAERWQLVAEWNDTAVTLPVSPAGPAANIAGQIAAQAARTPDAPALTADGRTWTYCELDAAAGRLAGRLLALGVGPEVPVALCAERSAEMVIGLLAVLRTGGAYLPLDPHYPRERLAFMLADADVPVLLTQSHLEAGLPVHHARVLLLDGAGNLPPLPGGRECGWERGPGGEGHPDNLAYVIYTSGSTGRPKGVGVRQRGVLNFFAGMDAAVGCGPGDRLLAVTSISFDISVLELFWTLARGAEVILAGEGAIAGAAPVAPDGQAAAEGAAARARLAARGMAFSLFYFASESGDTPTPAGGRYRLLLEGARFADRRGFAAVWTPERHFHAFGGLYPNPSVTGAAVAAVTERLAVRAGSVVLPLHDPLRVAEEWAVVDNLSGGRAGIAFASGWHADDFVFQPARYADRKAHLEQGIDTVRRLWRGEAVRRLGGAGREVEVRVLPRPVQPELPVWITAAGAAETFAKAGELGANVLTHLLGQSIDEVAEKVRVYRAARAAHGHDPETGTVTLMLHTLIGADRDEVRETVRGPFTAYLRSSLGLVANLARSLGLPVDVAAMAERDREDLLAFAFDRYFETSALFGDLQGGLGIVERLAGIGVDEVACLIDFGVDEARVLAGLEDLAALRDASNPSALRDAANAPQAANEPVTEDRSIAALGIQERSVSDLARRHRATMLQCTPSLLRLLADGPEGWAPLAGLRVLLLGGEALPAALAAAVAAEIPARLVNVYGPTETTVWSASHAVPTAEEAAGQPVNSPTVPIGRPIANTRIHLLDRRGQPVPAGVPGALHIAGDGLARGYLGRPDLTAERFLPDPSPAEPGGRCYDTGDLARRRADGVLEFLGRADQQIKLRGFRIELGEIEAALAGFPEVAEAAVIVRRGGAGDERLIAYWTPAGGAIGAGGGAVRDVGAIGAGSAVGADLRARLAERLPEPMVPAAVVMLAALPLTPNGKVDRGALARREISADAGEVGEGRPPATPTEEIVAGLYAGLLEAGPVAATDSFFALGGHSLLATQLLSRVRDTFQLELPLRALFESPTVEGLAARIEAARLAAAEVAQAPPIVPVAWGDRGALPLSFVQQRLWFLDQLEPGNPAYNNSAAVRLTGPLDVAALERSIGAVIERHEALRTTFPGDPATPGRPTVVIRSSAGEPAFQLQVESVESEAIEEAAERAREDARRPFDLARGPLLRARLLQLGPDDAVILLAVHHIVSDGWSLGVLVREVGEHYRAFVEGARPALPELPVQYADFAAWQRRWLSGAVLEVEVDSWRQALAGAPTVLELPADRPRPAVREPHGRTLRFVLPRDLADRLRAVSRDQGATLFMTLLAAFTTLLGVYTGRRDLLVGSPVANRGRSELEGLIGFFVNTLVLRADLGGDPSFAELLARTRETTLGAYAHQDVPFDQVIEALEVERDLSHTPLFQVAFALQNVALPRLDLPGVAAAPLAVDTGTVKFDWDLSLEETAAGLAGRLAYAAALFDPATVQRAMGHFETLLRGAAATPAAALSRLPLLTAGELQQLAEWNDPAVPYEPGGFLHRLIAAQAARTPDAVAVVFAGRRLTYGALEAQAERVAAELRALGANGAIGGGGVGPESIVGVLMERSLEMVVGLLAVWKAGAAYLPLDPEDPMERLDHLLRDAGAAALVTAERFAAALPAAAGELPVLVLGTGPHPLAPSPAERERGDVPDRLDLGPVGLAAPGLLPDHPAYVIYTSGSTGTPKGVVVSHRALANRARYAAATDRADAFLQKTTIGFDVSVMEIFGPLQTGGQTVLAVPGGQRDSAYLVRLIAEEQVSHASFPPTLLDVLLAEGALDDCRALRTVVTGGEAVPPSLPERFFARLADRPDIELFNRYGPTETTVSVTAWRCRTQPAGRTLPIGRPTASAEVHLLSPDFRPVPIGAAGEICLGGLCLARGYLDRPALTAEKWIPHPMSEEPGARLYRSGDLARFRTDGAIEFLGRVDHQVKIRGFRIELGEVAAVLATHEAVGEAVATAREIVRADGGAGGARQLIAYYVPVTATPPAESELRAFLQRRLPDYMLPMRFMALSALPTSRTGKVDTAALPVPDRPASAVEDRLRSPAEEVLAAIWAGVLGLDAVAGADNFFALGGSSLAAVQVMSRVREAFGVDLPLRALFEEPTVGGLALQIEAAQAARAGLDVRPPLRRAAAGEPTVPLSFAQERLWFLDRLDPGNAAYNMPAAFRLDGRLDAAALAASLGEVERRHGSLRTVFRAGESGPEQRVAPARPHRLPRVDLAGLPAAAREAELRRLVDREAAAPFDLASGPLWRVVLIALGEAEAALLVTLHHIVGDGWSIGVLIREVAALYRAFAASEAASLPEPPVQYTDYAVWQRRWLAEAAAGPEGGLAYWRRQLAEVPVLALPTDRPRPAEQTFAGGRQPLRLGAATSAAVVRLARQGSATPFMVLLAGFAALLQRLSGQDDFAVGTFVANRTRPEIEGLIGFFVNNLALRTRLDGDPAFGALVARARDTALGAFAAQDLPFEAVLDGLHTERSLARSPLFQVMLVLQNMPMERLALGDLTFDPAAGGRRPRQLRPHAVDERGGGRARRPAGVQPRPVRGGDHGALGRPPRRAARRRGRRSGPPAVGPAAAERRRALADPRRVEPGAGRGAGAADRPGAVRRAGSGRSGRGRLGRQHLRHLRHLRHRRRGRRAWRPAPDLRRPRPRRRSARRPADGRRGGPGVGGRRGA